MALLAGVALPGLVAVYLLHNRKKSRVVSSLMLFGVTEAPSFGGRRIEKSRLPWMLFLELLILAILVVAAAGPSLMATDVYRPLVVVLDDSYSMRAGQKESARQRALELVRGAIEENLGQPTRVILAGDKAVYAGENISRKEEIAGQLEKWQAGAGSAALGEAITMARQSLGPEVRILLVTDHEPEAEMKKSKSVKWHAFGKAGKQFAITQASVTRVEAVNLRCMVEVANLGGAEQAETFLSVVGPDGKVFKQMRVELAGGKAQQLIFEVPEGVDGRLLSAELSDDVLGIDNKVALAPPVDRRVTVGVAVKDEALRQYVLEAVKSTGLVKGAVRTGTTDAVDVQITDEKPMVDAQGKVENGGLGWRLVFERPTGAARTLTGPYVIKRGHPLLDGVALEGVLWPAADMSAAATRPASTQPASTQAALTQPAEEAMGVPLIYAGDQPLVWLAETRSGADLQVRFHLGDVSRSSLMQSPAWAVFFYNLLSARGLALPGPDRSMVPVHEQTHIKVPAGVEGVEVLLPDGKMRRLVVSDRQAVLTCGQVGVYEIKMGNGLGRAVVSAGALNRAESDLRDCKTGQWGTWVDTRISRERATDVSWALGLAGLLMLGLHAWLTVSKSQGDA